jgi:hypothetical protein
MYIGQYIGCFIFTVSIAFNILQSVQDSLEVLGLVCLSRMVCAIVMMDRSNVHMYNRCIGFI